jgi:predicted ABC-type ATPase
LKSKPRKPNLFIIAGPNGAGKTTFARKFLPQYAQCLEFVNADLIAGGLSPFSPERAAIHAGRLMLEQIHSLTERSLDFGFETTLSGKTYVKLLQEMKRRGYLIHIFFLWITPRTAFWHPSPFFSGPKIPGQKARPSAIP